jgi:hypothetical protein
LTSMRITAFVVDPGAPVPAAVRGAGSCAKAIDPAQRTAVSRFLNAN